MNTIQTAIGGNAGKAAIVAALFVVVAMLALGPGIIAQDANDTIILDVNVSKLAAIEVLPINITWNQLDPGSNGSVRNISIKNIGSVNLTNFYIDVNTEELETENPVATGNISKYAASGFMLFRNETPSTAIDYFHLGRLEWNLTEHLDTEVLDLAATTVNWSHGWYRKANGNEYLWKLENGTNSGTTQALCNASDTTLTIILNPENASAYSRDFSAGPTESVTPDAQNANWSFFSFSDSDNPLQGRCVAAYWDCTRIYIYKYDKASGFGDCSSSAYLATESLAPGEKLDKLKIKPSIPQGTPAGDSKTSTLTVYTSIA